MAFSIRSIEFLDENYVRNDREWFKQHKQDYEELIIKPFTELLSTLEPVMAKIDDKLICTPKCISRIYRDARYVKGGAVFRDSLWVSVRRKKEPFALVPEFYFYISLQGFGYGCGYYHAGTEAMQQMREMALSGDKVFIEAKKALEAQDRFYLAGEMYKKNRFPDAKPELWDWLNRKSVCACYDSTDSSELFSDSLFEKVAADLETLAPVYQLYVRMEERVTERSEKPHNTK